MAPPPGAARADGHLGDVDLVIAKNGAHRADDAGPVAVRETSRLP